MDWFLAISLGLCCVGMMLAACCCQQGCGVCDDDDAEITFALTIAGVVPDGSVVFGCGNLGDCAELNATHLIPLDNPPSQGTPGLCYGNRSVLGDFAELTTATCSSAPFGLDYYVTATISEPVGGLSTVTVESFRPALPEEPRWFLASAEISVPVDCSAYGPVALTIDDRPIVSHCLNNSLTATFSIS